MVLDERNKYTLLKKASQVLDRHEMKFSFNEEGVSDPNGNCVVPKISVKFLNAAQKEAFRCCLSEKKLHGVYFKQCQAEGWDTNIPIPGCQMVDCKRREKAWWALRRIHSGLSGPNSQVTVPELCHVCSLRR